MQLIAASTAKPTELRYMVRAVKVVKIFYVTTGRNAWWNTWITRYSPGCMHSTFDSAKKFCEANRVQGTVFYIDELPSLAFFAPERVLVISEINTDAFFGRLDFDQLTSITAVFPVSTMTLQQMSYIFRHESPLWPNAYPQRDSAILSFCSAPESLAEISQSDQLSSFASFFLGRGCGLSWENRPFNKNRASLHDVASAMSARISET